jgi:uridylate kinase
MTTPTYRRILLKLGGEALAGIGGLGINPDNAEEIAAKVRQVKELGVEIALVIGGGNLWRGREGLQHGMERATADYMA